MAGNSFMVTVNAPKAPCRHTHTSDSHGHSTGVAGLRRRSMVLTTAITRISAPTAVAR